MDNRTAEYATPAGDLVAELPREEALVRLYELQASYVGHSTPCPVHAAAHAGTDAYRPHAYRFGCCRDAGASPAAA